MTEPKHTVLIVDDEPAIRNALKSVLERDYHILLAADGPAALEILRQDGPIEVVLLDMLMPGMHGMEVLRRVRDGFPSVEIIVLSALHSFDTVVEAINLGAFDYVTKPFVARELVLIVSRAIELRTLKSQISQLRDAAGRPGELPLIGYSSAITELRRRAEELGRRRVPFLIVGERGAGKELFAHIVHTHRHGDAAPFTAVRCLDLAKQHVFRSLAGLDESRAEGEPARIEPSVLGLPCRGLILFKDAHRLEPLLQAALARLIEDLLHSGLCCAATVAPSIATALDEGRVDPTFYRVISEAVVVVPPLRERVEDIQPLADHFLLELRRRLNAAAERIEPAVIDELETYIWPGNVRELRNFIERMLILHADARVIDRSHLPDEIGATAARALSATDFIGKKTLKQAVTDLERRIILDALRRSDGIQTRASELLGTTRRILRYKMQQLGID